MSQLELINKVIVVRVKARLFKKDLNDVSTTNTFMFDWHKSHLAVRKIHAITFCFINSVFKNWNR